MTPPSNETLDFKIISMQEQNEKEHTALLSVMQEIKKDIKWLEDKFVMRREFKVAVWLVSVFATILGIVWFFIGK